MIKKIIALAAGTLFSLNASAGYVQYNLGGGLSGSIIQHDTDGSIAYFNLGLKIDGFDYPFTLSLTPQGSDGSTGINQASTYFASNGPTNFVIGSNYGGDQFTNLNVLFSRNAQGGFGYSATYRSSIYSVGGFRPYSGTHTGAASVGVPIPLLIEEIDRNGGYYQFVTRIVPTFIPAAEVPEPGSIALLAVGVLGMAARRRRQKV